MDIKAYIIGVLDLFTVAYLMSVCLGVNFPVTKIRAWLFMLTGAILTTWISLNTFDTEFLGVLLKSFAPFVIFMLMVYVVYTHGRAMLAITVGLEVSVLYFICQVISMFTVRFVAEYLSKYITFLNVNEIFSLCVFIVVITIANLLRTYLMKITKDIVIFIDNRKKSNFIRFVNYYAYILLIVFLSMFLSQATHMNSNFIMIVAFVFVILLFESRKFTQTVKETNLEEELAQQRLYMDNYKNILDDVRGFWHSYTNIMQVISVLVASSEQVDPKELKEVFAQFTDWEKINKLGQKIKLINIPHVALGGLLSSKLQKATQLGVNVNIKSIGEAEININMRDLLEIVGVLVDNAIEAAYYTDKRDVLIDIHMEPEVFTFNISNDYVLDKEKGKPMKYGKSNGVGLFRIQTIMTKTSQAKFTKTDENNKFTALLEVKNVKSA